jgi:hypothetical protein
LNCTLVFAPPGVPPLVIRESGRAEALNVALRLIVFEAHAAGVFVAQLIAVTRVKLRGPNPAGGTTPGAMFTVKRHCVPDGRITPLSPTRKEKLPLGPVPGVVEQPSPTGDIDPLNPTPFSVGDVPPGTTSTAEIVPQSYGKPLGSMIVPVIVVKPPCAVSGSGIAAHSSVAARIGV